MATDELEETANRSLAGDILETIQSILTRPRMYAATAESLEGQFFNMVVLVAPYSFGMSSQEAGRKIADFAHGITGTVLGISSTVDDIDALAHLLRKCYQENFEFTLKRETVH